MKYTTVTRKNVNTNTGEIIVTEQNICQRNAIFFISISSANYCKWLKKLKSINHLLVAVYVAINHDKNDKCFSTSINKFHIERISSIINKSNRTSYRIINDLIDANILKRQSNQLFANPTFFIKSTNTKNIANMIEYYNKINNDTKMPISGLF